jgi:phosphoglycerate dehydrogenase-like enzyme
MPPPTVLITESIATAPLQWLGSHAQVIIADSTGPTQAQLAQAQALVVRTYTQVDMPLLDRMPNLRVVARAGVGLDNIDVAACRARGIEVVHTPEANTHAVVEYVISMMLQTLRPIERMEECTDVADWGIQRAKGVSARTCVGTRLGIVGLGRIGSRVARVAIALGMEIMYTDLLEIDLADRCGATPCDLITLVQSCEVISIHVDGNDSNQHLFNEQIFAALRPDVVLINAARGFVIDTDCAIAFARANPRARLILDVHDPEPIPSDSELWTQSNMILTPHIGAGTASAKETMSWVVRDVMRVLNNEPPHHPAP